jgi:protein farnesyltransferase/geranylgeranyltransferase type-1 subunit alpha
MGDEYEFEDVAFVPIAERPEWAGVAPRRPPAAARRVAAVAACPADADLMDYFWAGVGAGEVSERMLALTEEVIVEYNAAHYSVWEWRWRCLQALGGVEARAGEEDALMQRVATDNPKNYQLWNHRRRCALALGPGRAAAEDAFSAACLAQDAKNYHAWAHRQAVVAAFGGNAWGRELEFTARLLEEDVRNNSAWNQRMFVVQAAPEGAAGPPAALHAAEVALARAKLAAAPHNAAAWAYLRGLAAARGAPPAALAGDARFKEACLEALREDASNASALELLADVYAAQAELLRSCPAADEEAAGAAAALAAELLGKLAVADPSRAAYYRHRRAALA